MMDEFGPWEPWSVEQIAQLFVGAPFRWWLTGGIAHAVRPAGLCALQRRGAGWTGPGP